MSRENVLIFRPDNIGDMVLFSGALRHIRALYATATITLAVSEQVVNLVEHCPHVDRILPIGKTLQSANIFGALGRKLYRMRNLFRPYTSVIYPVRSPNKRHLELVATYTAGEVVGITGCTTNRPAAGYKRRYAPEQLFTRAFDLSPYPETAHELAITVKFLAWLGCPVTTIDDIWPEFWLDNRDLATAARLIPAAAPVVGLFPFASDRRRCWDLSQYAAAFSTLPHGGSLVIFGSPADREDARLLAADLSHRAPQWAVTDLTGALSLRELYACIRQCTLLISTDSAGLHMGIGARIPTLALAGGGQVYRFPSWGTPSRNNVLYHDLGCAGCQWKCRYDSFRCVEQIAPDTVARAISELLAHATEGEQ